MYGFWAGGRMILFCCCFLLIPHTRLNRGFLWQALQWNQHCLCPRLTYKQVRLYKEHRVVLHSQRLFNFYKPTNQGINWIILKKKIMNSYFHHTAQCCRKIQRGSSSKFVSWTATRGNILLNNTLGWPKFPKTNQESKCLLKKKITPLW